MVPRDEASMSTRPVNGRVRVALTFDAEHPDL
jgi:hypothetical protein